MQKEFSIKGYKNLLEIAIKKRYSFSFFDEIKTMNNEKFCFFRHDIDADLDAARNIALVEKEYGVKSTYFVMTRSTIYNLFGRYNHRCVEDILKAGHQLALHYDEGFYPSNNNNLQELVETEAYFLYKMFGQKITTVSFHQPSSRVLSNEIKLNGFINTYDKFDMAGIYYISDSNMVWKNKTAWDLFESEDEAKIQLLTHPMWWMGSGKENTEVLWDKALLGNMNRTLKQVFDIEGAFGKQGVIELKRKE
ncbi:MAG TPA: hypothetical protein VNX01_03560 [Bacteroidia bacterium]|jgi:hypothetical protein|nr:hypothetical protein [Bacteroidia bacterium]